MIVGQAQAFQDIGRVVCAPVVHKDKFIFRAVNIPDGVRCSPVKFRQCVFFIITGYDNADLIHEKLSPF